MQFNRIRKVGRKIKPRFKRMKPLISAVLLLTSKPLMAVEQTDYLAGTQEATKQTAESGNTGLFVGLGAGAVLIAGVFLASFIRKKVQTARLREVKFK